MRTEDEKMSNEKKSIGWKELMMIEREERDGRSMEAARMCNYAGLYERAINNALTSSYHRSEGLEFALEVATRHRKERADSIYQSSLNCSRNYRDRIRLAKIARKPDEEKRIIDETLAEAEKSADLYKAAQIFKELGEKRKAAETFESYAAKGNSRGFFDAAEIYDALGECGKAAELYEKHGSYSEQAEKCFVKAGMPEKAQGIYRKRRRQTLVEILKHYDGGFLTLLEDIRHKDYREAVARDYVLKCLDRTRKADEYQALREQGASGNKPSEILESFCREEDRKKKLREIASSGTNFYIRRRGTGCTDNFGEEEIHVTSHLDLELEGISPDMILTGSIYLLATDSQNLFSFQKEAMLANINNILKYRRTPRFEIE
jgi:hypothetical protein